MVGSKASAALLQGLARHNQDALPGKTFACFDDCVRCGAAVYHPILREKFVDAGLHVKEVPATSRDPIGPSQWRGDTDRRDGLRGACEPPGARDAQFRRRILPSP